MNSDSLSREARKIQDKLGDAFEEELTGAVGLIWYDNDESEFLEKAYEYLIHQMYSAPSSGGFTAQNMAEQIRCQTAIRIASSLRNKMLMGDVLDTWAKNGLKMRRQAQEELAKKP